jgi:organic hydroperoxide reductase OsmC/OhrA
MREGDDGSGAFVGVRLRPTVKICAGSDRAKAIALHNEAHRFCFVANSVNFPVEVAPEIQEVAVSP